MVRAARAALLAYAVLVGGPHALNAQAIRGAVLDAVSGTLLGDATVTLEPLETGALVPARGPGVASVLRAVTGSDGAYSFTAVPLGRYVMRVERLGYHPARVEIALRGGIAPAVSVALRVEPLALEPITVVTGRGAPTLPSVRLPMPEGAGEEAEASLRDRYMDPGTVALSGDHLALPSAFAETDLFRALQRTPGVATRDEFTAELWTRGGSWGQTRVYLDDLPVFGPLFGGGALSALGPAAVGGVFLHPGARPVSMGEGAAGVVRLATRRAEERKGLPFLAEVAMGSLQGSTESRFLDGRAGLSAYGRRSWFDQIWNGFVDDGHDPEGPFRYVVRSSLWRADAEVPAGGVAVYSRFRATDELDGNAAGLVTATRGLKADAADQVSLLLPAGGHRLRLAGGRSTHRVSVAADERVATDRVPGAVRLRPATVRLSYDLARLELEPATGPRGFSAGAEVVRQSAAASGAAAVGGTDGSASPSMPASNLVVVSSWLGYRTRPFSMVEVEAGLRMDLGGPVRGSSWARPAPHLAIRVTPAPDLSVTLSRRTSHQYLQQLGAAGTRFGAGHVFRHAWTLAGPEVPAARSSILTLGVERRLAHGWWMNVNAWDRRTLGVTMPDPAPGAFPETPVPWKSGHNVARGMEAQVRKLVGAVTGSVAYARVGSRNTVGGLTYTAPSERRHEFDASLHWRMRPALSLLASFEAVSGATDTRVVRVQCSAAAVGAPTCADGEPVAVRGEPAGLHGPASASLDLGVAWTRDQGTWGLAVSLQLQDVLGTARQGGYLGTDCPPDLDPAACVRSASALDRYQELGWMHAPLPLAALRVWF